MNVRMRQASNGGHNKLASAVSMGVLVIGGRWLPWSRGSRDARCSLPSPVLHPASAARRGLLHHSHAPRASPHLPGTRSLTGSLLLSLSSSAGSARRDAAATGEFLAGPR